MTKPVFAELIASVDRRKNPRTPHIDRCIGRERADNLAIDLALRFPRSESLLADMEREPDAATD